MIASRMRQIAVRHPDAAAIVSSGHSTSYAELLRAGAHVGRFLEQRGLRPCAFVMASLPVSVEAAAVFIGCANAGLAFFPVNPAWTTAELQWLIRQLPPAAVIVSIDDIQRWLDAGVQPEIVLAAEDCLSSPDIPPQEERRSIDAPVWPKEHVFAAVTSSGSTGQPKIALWTAGRILGISDAVAEACAIGPGSRLLATVPLHHGYGLSNSLMMPLLSGATIVTLDRFDPLAAARAIEQHSIECLLTSPSAITLLVDAAVPTPALHTLRLCLSGGGPLAPSAAAAWKTRYGIPLGPLYGSSEAGLIAMEPQFSADGECVGRPLPGTEIRILSGDDDVPCGEMGEIAVRGPGVIERYWGEAPLNFSDGFLRTGDLGRLDADGKLYVAGRLRPWINTGGTKVDPVEVQRVIATMPGVRQCIVEAEQSASGMDVVAVVIAAEPGFNLTRADVIKHSRRHLAEYKIPRVIRFVTAISADLGGKSARAWNRGP